MPACTSPVRLPHRAEGQRYSGVGNTVPCGKCIACRLNHGRDWALRITHEAKLHDRNCFITLTYSDALLPADHGLSKREFQLFMKRLRRHFEPNTLRFFGCGEYGENTARPHYHLILFGEDFSADRKVHKTAKSGQPMYRSELLDSIWELGYCLLGDVTPGSAVYVARYNMKKSAAWRAGERYIREDLTTDPPSVWSVEPEFLLMSRRPGIGSGWWDKYKSDAFPSDFLILDGKRMPVPRYYRLKYNNEEGAANPLLRRSFPLDRKRAVAAGKHPEEASPARRRVRDEVLHRAGPQAREVPDHDI